MLGFSTFQGIDGLFWFFALSGTLFFLLRVAVMVVGGFGAGDIVDGADAGGGAGGEHADSTHHSAQLEGVESSFKLITINSLTGFFMMFGWGALAAHRQFHLGNLASFGIGSIAGLATMAATAYLFQGMMKLHHAGQTFPLEKAVGLTAQVYTQISAGGRGQVQIVYNQSRYTVDAVSEDGTEVGSFKDVRVTGVRDSHTLIVKPLS
jgi:hypothetical protein